MRHLLAITAMSAIAAAFTVPACAATVDLSTLNLAGSAKMVDGELQLTQNTNVSAPSGVAGAAWVAQGISTTSSFSTTFKFSLKGDSGSRGSMADGIALAFQNVGNSVSGVGGGDVGYWNIGGSGSGAVGSVIRTWNNNDFGLSIDGKVQGLTPAGWNMGATNNMSGEETVSYNASTHVLTMTGSFIDMTTGTAHAVNDSKKIDLSAKFGSLMYIGFTGGTAGTDADQRITSFAISAVPEADTYAMLLGGLGLVGFAARRRKQA